MGKWDEIIKDVFADIATVTPGGGWFRDNISLKLFETEKIAASGQAASIGETAEQRVNEIREELKTVLADRLKIDLENKVWQETGTLLKLPMLRREQYRWPWDRK